MTATASPLPASPLPKPTDLPEADIVIYDGDCRFCGAQVRRLHHWDGKNRLAFLSLHDPEVARRFSDLTHEQLMSEMYVITREGTRYGGASAFRFLTRRLPRLWPLAPIMHIPFSLPLWRFASRQVAKRRYQWFGTVDRCENGTCEIHFKS